MSNEATEQRLFDAWNGTNPSLPVPASPIDAGAYEYTTAIKVYDSVGASHDLTVYFDRTTQANQWEFLVTCEPSEDNRVLTTGRDASGALDGTNDEASIYTPDTAYNYENHKGAGALLYGVLNFSTSGAISNITAWNVPPDGAVDPAQTTNLLTLGNTDQYYSFAANFTGATTNQQIELNLGARYSGQSTAVSQVLVSDGAAYATAGTSTPITKETLWSTVYDSAGTLIDSATPATVSFSGYDNDGTAVNGSYTLAATDKVQDLLDAMDAVFNSTSTIDAAGKIKMTDATGGVSGMSVTSFFFSSGVNPFGGTALVGTHAVVSGDATHYFATTAAAPQTPAAAPAALLTSLYDAAGPPGIQIAATDTFQFSGTAVDGTAFVAGAGTTFIVGAASTVQDLLTFLSDLYANGSVTAPTPVASPNVTATLGADGRIRIVDNTGGTSLAVTIAASVGGSFPLGTDTTAFTALTSSGSQINITTSKRQVVSTARAQTTALGGTPINDSTPLDSVYDAAGVPLTATDTLAFVGVRGDGTPVVSSFIAGSPISGVGFGSPLTAPNNPPTMQDLLTWLEDQFHAEATVDGAGRLVLTDRVADEVAATGYHSQLKITSITNADSAGLPLDNSSPFGAGLFTTIAADASGEDGSRVGDTMSLGFSTEALSTTQYANSSTTIFQDQNGFAAGFLQSVSVDTAGIITGNYSNGQVLERAQVALASFNNLAGLSKEGGNIFRETTASGAPITGPPATNGLGTISPNSLEQSNVDLGAEFVKLITTQRGFQANSKIITTTDEMLADLINIKR
jgi:flagellar hook protein FlgE